MDASRWDQIKKLFEAAEAIEPPVRAEWIRAHASGDEDLIRQVQSLLLAAEGEATDPVTSVLGKAAAAALETVPRALGPGVRVGPYEILHELGHGGMGTVYRAFRADDAFRKEVAIKLLRGSVFSPETLRRFRSERQILADLDHPNIARMVDGGATPDGLPYVAMEYVDGAPIDEYADQHQLTVDDRLRVFALVLEAVSHAHRNLVVHRDLKPANILVTDEGVPKLLDFGIAKLLDPGVSPHSIAITQPQMRLMTPAYASPEQVLGKPVSTASDVYSLGVVLYELLVGRRPYKIETGELVEFERAVVGQEAERPSTAIGRSARTLAADGVLREVDPAGISASRKADIDWLRRTLAGDIDNIVLKALEKDPSRRYASVEQFSSDIRRYLDGRPVLARPQSFAYRAGKFARRNRTLVASIAAAIVLLVSLVSFYTLRLRAERDLAQREARKAEQISKFLTSIFEQADPDQAQGDSLTAEKILDQGADRLENELRDEPIVRAAMFDTIGRVYRSLGKYDRSQELLERSLKEFNQRAPGPSLELAKLHFDLGELAHYRERYEEAGARYQQALAIYGQLGASESGDAARALDLLGRIRWQAGLQEEGVRMQQEALAIRTRLFGPESLETAESYHSIGMREANAGRHNASIEYFERELKIMEANGREYPALINNIASGYSHLGRLPEAEAMYEKCVTATRNVYGDKHRFMVFALSGSADVAFNLGKKQKAIDLFEKAMHLSAVADGEGSPTHLFTKNNLGRVLVSEGRFGDAEKLLREALRDAKALGPDGTSRYADALAALRDLFEKSNRLDLAERYAREVLKVDLELHGETHPYVATDYANIAKLSERRNEFDAAEEAYRSGLSIQSKVDAGNEGSLSVYQKLLGDFLLRRQRPAEARPLLEAALQAQRTLHPDGSPSVAELESMLGAALAALGERQQAASLLNRSVAYLSQTPGPGDPLTKAAVDRLAAYSGKPIAPSLAKSSPGN